MLLAVYTVLRRKGEIAVMWKCFMFVQNCWARERTGIKVLTLHLADLSKSHPLHNLWVSDAKSDP